MEWIIEGFCIGIGLILSIYVILYVAAVLYWINVICCTIGLILSRFASKYAWVFIILLTSGIIYLSPPANIFLLMFYYWILFCCYVVGKWTRQVWDKVTAKWRMKNTSNPGCGRTTAFLIKKGT